MSDITIRIDGEDDGAMRLLRTLEEALRNLSQQGQQTGRQQARAAREANEARRAETASIRANAQAEALAARERIANLRAQQQQANNAARAARLATQQTLQQARAAQQAANQQARLQLQQARAAAQQAQQTSSATALIGNMTKRIVAFTTVVQGAQLFASFINEGLKFNEVLESSALGIAAIITATSTVKDPLGNIVEGAEALNTAVALAEDQLDKLRVAGLQTAATTQELVGAYQSAVAAGTAAGLNLEEIRQVTVQIVQAAASVGLPMQQLEQEVRSILDATIDRNSRVARVLNITNEQVRQAKEQNRLAEMLNERLESFNTSGERAVQTFRVMKSTLVEAVQVFAGAATEPLFEDLGKAGQRALREMFDFDEARIADQFQPILDTLALISDLFGDSIGDAVDATVEGAANLSRWLIDNKLQVEATAEAFQRVLDGVGHILVGLGDVIAAIIDVGVELGLWEAGLDGIADITERISDLLHGLADFIREDGRLFLALTGTILAMMNPILAGRIALVGLAAAVAGVAREEQVAIERAERNAIRRASEAEQAFRLAHELDEIQKKLASGSLSAAEMNQEQRRMAALMAQVERLGPQYKKIIDANRESHENITTAMREEADQRLEVIRGMYQEAAARLNLARIVLKAFEETGAETHQLETLRREVVRAEDAFISLAQTLSDMEQAKIGAKEPLGSVEARVGDPDKNGEKAVADFRRKIEAQIRQIEELLKTQRETIEGELARNQISYREYYERLKGYEKSAADQQMALLEQLKGRLTDEGEIERVEADIQRLREELKRINLQADEDLRLARKKLADDILEVHIQMLENQGDMTEAASLRMQKQYEELYRKIGTEADDLQNQLNSGQLDEAAATAIQEQLDALRTAQLEIALVITTAEARAGLQEVEKELADAQARLDSQLQSVQARTITGSISERQGRQEVIRVYREYLQELQEQQIILDALNTIHKDPEVQRALQQNLQAIDETTVALREAEIAAMTLERAIGSAVLGSIQTLLSTGFQSAMDETMRAYESHQQEIRATADEIDAALEAAGVSVQERTKAVTDYMSKMGDELGEVVGVTDVVKEAFRAMALDVVQAIQSILAQIIAFEIATKALKFAGASDTFISAAFGAAKFATGGMVTGPGTATSDSIPARLSTGEYVLNARVVGMIGKDALDEINFGMSRPAVRSRHHYATGGMVVDKPSAPLAAGHDDKLTVGLEDGLVLKEIQSQRGTRIMLRQIEKNSRAFRTALGV